MQIDVLPDAAGAASFAADWLARRLRDAVHRRGEASVAFSGGSTPAAMLADLATLDVPWKAVHAYQVDERVAPEGDRDRNLNLLAVLPMPKRNVHAMAVNAASLATAARRYEVGLPERFDVVHLGLGDDGHTASWPPGDPVIDATESVGVTQLFNGRVRLTLTPHVVNRARCRLLLVAGASKAEMVERFVLRDSALPVDRVRRSATWLVLDAAAAVQLNR